MFFVYYWSRSGTSYCKSGSSRLQRDTLWVGRVCEPEELSELAMHYLIQKWLIYVALFVVETIVSEEKEIGYRSHNS